jgi:hypothetical protein
MSTKAGTLLWNRMRIDVPGSVGNGGPPGTLDVDTGLRQVNQSFAGMSPGEPSFGDPSRVQVIPMVPTANWTPITHGEPFLDPATGTIHVVFANTLNNDSEINVLFWDPHSMIGPGEADTYNP